MSAEIRVSHAGSLPRTPELIEANREYQSQNRAALAGDNTAANTSDLDAVLSASVEDVLRRQKQIGVTEPNDGEYGHAMAAEFDYGAWWHYRSEERRVGKEGRVRWVMNQLYSVSNTR